ncbi:MAG: hypothetical protein ACREKE_09370, partial [bacterium]
MLSGYAALAYSGTCTPSGASITFQSDDVFSFWLNGIQIVNGVEAGAIPTSVDIPIADFEPAGQSNSFAAEVVNNSCCQVGADWLITVQCSDGSQSYITDADSTFTMYDDQTGGNPPPEESGLAWYQPAYSDPTLFNQTPVDAALSGWWYTPVTNPENGDPLPVLSHSTTGTQAANGDVETLYFVSDAPLVEQPTP